MDKHAHANPDADQANVGHGHGHGHGFHDMVSGIMVNGQTDVDADGSTKDTKIREDQRRVKAARRRTIM